MLGGSVAFWFTLLFTEDFLSMTGGLKDLRGLGDVGLQDVRGLGFRA